MVYTARDGRTRAAVQRTLVADLLFFQHPLNQAPLRHRRDELSGELSNA
jgi:hypothetical protein